ncbi:MAG: hypothetical protein GX022_03385 [Clostridiaceae bacterium]|nr:hypothetical protein [Clostridiaceae bacterium]
MKSFPESQKSKICILLSLTILFTLCPFSHTISSGRLYLDKVYHQTLSNATEYVLALKEDGSLWAWGRDQYPFGMHSNLYPSDNVPTPKELMKNTKIVSISADYRNRMYIMEDGSLWFQGRNPTGKLILGEFPNLDLTKIADNVISAACSTMHCAYVTYDGSLYMWGYNLYGQLGDGTTEPCESPKKMMDDVLTVSISGDNTVVLKRDGSVWQWKFTGVYESRKITKVMDGAIYASAGSYHCAAIKADNSLWVWGDNSMGQLGNGKRTIEDKDFNIIVNNNSEEPLKIMDDVILVQADWYNTAALKKDGSLWLWGPEFDRIYDDKAQPVTKPKKILDDVAGFSLGAFSLYAIKKDGSVWVMGYPGNNSFFATTGLGTDKTIKEPTPLGLKVKLPGFVTLPGKTPFSDVPLGYPHEDAIKWASENGIIVGHNGMFRPDDSLTEAHFVTMLAKYGQVPYDETYMGTHYSDKFYNALAEYNLPLKGYTDPTAKDIPLNRGEIARIIAAVFGLDYDLEDSIVFMYANNFSAGMSTTERTVETYGKDYPFTRAAAASFLSKMSSVARVVDVNGNIIPLNNRKIIGLKQ